MFAMWYAEEHPIAGPPSHEAVSAVCAVLILGAVEIQREKSPICFYVWPPSNWLLLVAGGQGARPVLLSQGVLERREVVCLLVVASAFVTRGLHRAQCNGCHGNCCAWSGVTSWAAGTGPTAPPSVLLSLTQQCKCGLAPHAWEFDREAEQAFLFLVLPYVLHSGEKQEN